MLQGWNQKMSDKKIRPKNKKCAKTAHDNDAQFTLEYAHVVGNSDRKDAQ